MFFFFGFNFFFFLVSWKLNIFFDNLFFIFVYVYFTWYLRVNMIKPIIKTLLIIFYMLVRLGFILFDFFFIILWNSLKCYCCFMFVIFFLNYLNNYLLFCCSIVSCGWIIIYLFFLIIFYCRCKLHRWILCYKLTGLLFLLVLFSEEGKKDFYIRIIWIWLFYYCILYFY